jgi:hypothetical protein
MTTSINVQFSDATDATIIAYFGCPQNATVYPNQRTVTTSDARWATFYDALPASAQQGLPAPTSSLVRAFRLWCKIISLDPTFDWKNSD